MAAASLADTHSVLAGDLPASMTYVTLALTLILTPTLPRILLLRSRLFPNPNPNPGNQP